MSGWEVGWNKTGILYFLLCDSIPCSIFYVFYEQYLTIWRDALVSLGLSLLSIAGVTYILTGERRKDD